MEHAGGDGFLLIAGGLQLELQGLIQPARLSHRPVDSKQGLQWGASWTDQHQTAKKVGNELSGTQASMTPADFGDNAARWDTTYCTLTFEVAWAAGAAYRFTSLGNPRFPRRVSLSYSVRNRPRCVNTGRTRTMKSLNTSGYTELFIINPSATPALSIASAMPARRRLPEPAL